MPLCSGRWYKYYSKNCQTQSVINDCAVACECASLDTGAPGLDLGSWPAKTPFTLLSIIMFCRPASSLRLRPILRVLKHVERLHGFKFLLDTQTTSGQAVRRSGVSSTHFPSTNAARHIFMVAGDPVPHPTRTNPDPHLPEFPSTCLPKCPPKCVSRSSTESQAHRTAGTPQLTAQRTEVTKSDGRSIASALYSPTGG